jgi:hypothetical protein
MSKMGQYYRIVNLDKKELLNPYTFGDGAKLLEFGSSGTGMMCGLAILLADGNNRGGGDLRSENEIIGSWAGDRVVVAGDYADDGKFLGEFTQELNQTLYWYAEENFTDISGKVVAAMKDDPYIRHDLEKAGV